MLDTLAGPGPGQAPVLDGHTAYAGQPVLVTEFGGIGLDGDPVDGHFAYTRAANPAELTAMLTDQVAALTDSALAGFCYTQLTDTEQEVNGLLTADRRPKAPLSALRSAITATPEQPTGPTGADGTDKEST